MRTMTRAVVRLSIAGLASLMAFAASAASAQDALAQVIGSTN